MDYILPFLGFVLLLVGLLISFYREDNLQKRIEKFFLSNGYEKRLLYGDEFYYVRDKDDKTVALKTIHNLSLKEIKEKYR